MNKIIAGLLIFSSLNGLAHAADGVSEKFYVNQIKLLNLFNKKLNQPFNLKDFSGEWLRSVRTDAIYPGGCHPKLILTDPHIERRAEFNLEIDVDAYSSKGGPEMNLVAKTVGGKTLVLDQQMNFEASMLKGSLALWSRHSYGSGKYCVVVKPSEVSQITSLPFATPSREFLVCKKPSYDSQFDPKRECIREEYDPEVEFSSDDIDTQSARCIEIALKNPCTHYSIYVRNH